MEHYALRLIVHVMGDGYFIRAQLFRGPMEEFIALLPRRLLQRLALEAGYAGYIQFLADQRHPQPFAQLLDEVLVVIRLRPPYAVVQMGCAKLKAHFRRYFQQHMQQRHRIRAAAQAHQHPLVFIYEAVFVYGAFYFAFEFFHINKYIPPASV